MSQAKTMSQLIYPLNKTSEHTYEFITNKKVRYVIYLTPLRHLEYLFTGEKGISAENFYYLVIERKGDKKGASADIYIKRTVALSLFEFFTQNSQAIIVFNYSNMDSRILGRRVIFKKWYDEYSQGTLYRYYQHDFKDQASICALYRRYSAHPNFVNVEEEIKATLHRIASVNPK